MAVKGGHKEELDELEKRLDELRRKFELFFQGSKEQRIPPLSAQAQLGGELRRAREEDVKNWNTQDKFRFNQIFARFVSLDRVWARTLKQIEDGTHKRDKFKVQRLKQREQVDAKSPGTAAKKATGRDPLDDFDVDVSNFDDGFPLAPPKPTAPAPVGFAPPAGLAPPGGKGVAPPQRAPSAPKPSSAGTGMSEQRLQQLYDVYMQAKRRTGESSSLTLDVLKRQIEKQIPAIKAKHRCEHVDFKVVLKDGKAILKAIPR